MIVLFSDFGFDGPYVGQMKAVLADAAPGVPVIDLMHDAPSRDPRAAAYLLAAVIAPFPEHAVFCTVVDPGVGGPRLPVIVEADGRRFVGPGNGLLEIVMRRAERAQEWRLALHPPDLSASSRGRDSCAPAAATLAAGHAVPRDAVNDRLPGHDWPDDVAEIIYLDRFGNAMTGLRVDTLGDESMLRVGGQDLIRVRTFSDVGDGEAFCYENSCGLMEIAVNGGSAASDLGLSVGTPIEVKDPT